ncbi:hypothetical protein [Corynebacterium aquilae]|uniref:Pilus assembly protein TadE n=1 Tax=Corynebacterium aquilae DSM 44791 TaxID=1431546 RepID=A0A1L7CDH5_9CORY|nr:hypothetical protein [Corynebacterium aquilae]APT83879.1 hypothetical protein CAQU_00940 [Corynebacterium aquilae DSM 44791]
MNTTGEDGNVTIEAAIAAATLILITGIIVAGLATLSAHIAATHTASATARALAIGETPTTPPNTTITWEITDNWVTVTATHTAPLGNQTATATFPAENLP